VTAEAGPARARALYTPGRATAGWSRRGYDVTYLSHAPWPTFPQRVAGKAQPTGQQTRTGNTLAPRSLDDQFRGVLAETTARVSGIVV
jgi:hypothetical protein